MGGKGREFLVQAFSAAFGTNRLLLPHDKELRTLLTVFTGIFIQWHDVQSWNIPLRIATCETGHPAAKLCTSVHFYLTKGEGGLLNGGAGPGRGRVETDFNQNEEER